MANDIENKNKIQHINKRLKNHNNRNDESSGKVFEDVLLYLIQLTCQLTYFDRHVNWIKFIRTSSESDMQHNHERADVSRGLL